MGLTGGKKTAPKKASPKPHVKLRDLFDQLDREFDAYSTLCLTADSAPSVDAQGLMAYFFCCVRVALHWVGGDILTFEFPASFKSERLSKLADWLKQLPATEWEAARRAQLTHLHSVWPKYAEKCTTYSEEMEALGFTWDGIDSLWQSEDGTTPDPPQYLPKFHCKESEDFHLISLAVLFLNRRLRRRLSDLSLPDAENAL